jgi:DNA-binding MarR family transcriptional regulator
MTAPHPYARLRKYRRGWYAAGLSDGQVKVLEALLLRQPADLEPTSIGLEVLAADLDRSRGSIQQTTSALEDAGWIIAETGRQGRLWRRAVLADSADAAAAGDVDTARARPARLHAQSARARHAQSARIARAHRDSLRDSLRDSARDADDDDGPWATAPPIDELRKRLRGVDDDEGDDEGERSA